MDSTGNSIGFLDPAEDLKGVPGSDRKFKGRGPDPAGNLMGFPGFDGLSFTFLDPIGNLKGFPGSNGEFDGVSWI